MQIKQLLSQNQSNLRKKISQNKLITVVLVIFAGLYVIILKRSINTSKPMRQLDAPLAPEVNLTTTPVPVSSSSPSNSPKNVNWNIYTSTKYHYSIEYPKDWFINPEAEDAIYGVTTLSNYNIKTEDPTTQSVTIDISIYDLPEYQRAQFLTQALENYEGNSFVSNPTLMQESDLRIGNLKTLQIKSFHNISKKYVYDLIAFPNPSQVIVTSLSEPDHYSYPIIQQILSSIEFSEQH